MALHIQIALDMIENINMNGKLILLSYLKFFRTGLTNIKIPMKNSWSMPELMWLEIWFHICDLNIGFI